MVIGIITMCFLFINYNTSYEFVKFIKEKKHKQEICPTCTHNNINHSLLKKFKLENLKFAKNSPEARFLKATKRSLILVFFLGILFSLIISHFLSKFLLKRIYYLKNSMNKYKNKGVFEKITHDHKDEIDDLVDIYNHLIEKIEKQEQIRKEFFIDMSHELRTPITSVKGYLEGLIDDVFDPHKKPEIYNKALGETDRMTYLIKEMMNLAKLESGKTTLIKKNTDLKKLTQKAIDSLENELHKKNMTISFQGQAQVNIDQNKFIQVFLNLIDNAISYGQKNSEIKIEISKKKKQGVFWIIKNIPEKELDSENFNLIFERFYREDKSRVYDKTRQHLGIGLNIVKKIVELHQGSITAKKESNQMVFIINI